MRRSTKLVSALAVAGIIVTGGTAYTASSTIDEGAKTVGATSQTISGVAVSSVSYTWDSATDATSAVDFTIGSALGTNDTLTVKLGSTAGVCDLVGASTVDYTCTWATPVVNATALSIVVN